MLAKVTRFDMMNRSQLEAIMEYCEENGIQYKTAIEVPVIDEETVNMIYKTLVTDKYQEILTAKKTELVAQQTALKVAKANVAAGIATMSDQDLVANATELTDEEIERQIQLTDEEIQEFYVHKKTLYAQVPDTVYAQVPEVASVEETPIIQGQDTLSLTEKTAKYLEEFRKIDEGFELQVVEHKESGEICFHLWWPKRQMVQECTSTKLLDMALTNAKRGADDPELIKASFEAARKANAAAKAAQAAKQAQSK